MALSIAEMLYISWEDAISCVIRKCYNQRAILYVTDEVNETKLYDRYIFSVIP